MAAAIECGVGARAIDAFCRLMRALHAATPEAWLSTDLTLAGLKVLMYLGGRERAAGRELARALGVGPSAVSQLVDRLVQQGYVQRAEDATDRRITWLALTPAGEAVVERLLVARHERLAATIDALSADQQARVAEALTLLADAAGRTLAIEENTE